MKKIILGIMLLLCLQGVLASSVTRSFSSTNVAPGDTLTVTLDVVVNGGDSFYTLDEVLPSTSWTITSNGGLDTTEPGHLKAVVITGATSTQYQYQITVPGVSGSYDFSGEYGFDDLFIYNISGQKTVIVTGIVDTTPPVISNHNADPSQTTSLITWTTNENSDSKVYYGITSSLGSVKSSSSLVSSHSVNLDNLTSNKTYYYKVGSCDVSGNCANSSTSTFTTLAVIPIVENDEDDLMVNYIRGKITIDGVSAPIGTSYKVEVLTGLNAGMNYTGTVDDGKIPASLKGNGYYDTGDQIIFSSGNLFKISLVVYGSSIQGTFVNGGNGNFNTSAGLVNINYVTPDNPPIVTLLTPANDAEFDGDDINFTYSVTDNLATTLSCNFYSNVNGNFESLSSQTISNGGIGNFSINSVSDGTYIWNVKCSDGISNVFSASNRSFTIERPDAPILQNINNIIKNEGELITIIANATDQDGDTLNYNINDSRFTQASNLFSWQTNYSDSGIYYVLVSVSDGVLSDNQSVKITINNANQPPVINPIADVTIEEDSGFNLDGTLSATDPDGTIASFSIASENRSEVDCDVSDSILGVTPANNWFGNATCIIRVTDNEGGTNETSVKIIVNNVNDAPTIESYYPQTNPIITETESYEFSIDWEDNDNADVEVNINWYVNGVLADIGDDYTFQGDGSVGTFNIIAIVSDGEFNISKEWSLTTSNIPITNMYNGATTNFAGMGDYQLSGVNLILEILGFGRIEYLEAVDLRNVLDLDAHSYIEAGLAAIDSGFFSVLNKRARITLYNLNYDKTPTIYYDNGFTTNKNSNNVCPDSICSNINYSNGNLTFEVSGFSSFFVGDTRTCSQQGGVICASNLICSGNLITASDSNSCCSTSCVPSFSDIDRCEIPNDNIGLTINEPDSGDDFELEDIIEVEIKIKNNFDEKKEFDWEFYLYDLTDDDKIEKVKDGIKIKSGKSEDIDFELEIPDDLDEDNEYYLFLIAEDEDNSSICNEKFIKIDIERKEHSVVIDNVEFQPNSADAGDSVMVTASVENLGTSDEEVYLRISNSELGISVKTDEFEIEEYGEDDEIDTAFYFDVPKSAVTGTYNFEIVVVYDDGEDSITKELIIENGNVVSSNSVIYLNSEGKLVQSSSGLITGELIYLSDECTISCSNRTSSGGTIYLNSKSEESGVILLNGVKSSEVKKVGDSTINLGFNSGEMVSKEPDAEINIKFEKSKSKKAVWKNTLEIDYSYINLILGWAIVLVLALIVVLSLLRKR